VTDEQPVVVDPIITALRAARLRLRLKQAELAERLDITQSMLSSYETGARPVTLEFLRAWTTALGMDLRAE
jgi:transcriptional regulator with XRE-family HTH domain